MKFWRTRTQWLLKLQSRDITLTNTSVTNWETLLTFLFYMHFFFCIFLHLVQKCVPLTLIHTSWPKTTKAARNKIANGVLHNTVHKHSIVQNVTRFLGTCVRVISFTHITEVQSSLSLCNIQMLNKIMYRFLILNFTQTSQKMWNAGTEIR